MLQLTVEQAAAVAVAVVEAVRVPAGLDRFDFFTKNDVWLFMGELDAKQCDQCLSYDGLTLTGEAVLGLFPWLEIEDLMSIRPMVHPNCRCRLERVSPLPADLSL